MTTCDEIRTDLGAHALGALEPEEAKRVEAHLEGCERCLAELTDLSLAADQLRTPAALDLAEENDGPSPPDLGLSRVAAARAKERGRLNRLRAGAIGSGAAFLLALALAAYLGARPVDPLPPSGAPRALRAAPGTPASATVTLSPRRWGTQVDLIAKRLPRLPPSGYYEVWALRRDGTRVPAGTLRPTTPGGQARVRLAAATAKPGITRVAVTQEGDGASIPVLTSDP